MIPEGSQGERERERGGREEARKREPKPITHSPEGAGVAVALSTLQKQLYHELLLCFPVFSFLPSGLLPLFDLSSSQKSLL